MGVDRRAGDDWTRFEARAAILDGGVVRRRVEGLEEAGFLRPCQSGAPGSRALRSAGNIRLMRRLPANREENWLTWQDRSAHLVASAVDSRTEPQRAGDRDGVVDQAGAIGRPLSITLHDGYARSWDC